MAVQVINTNCTKQQQEEDLPELEKLHAEAMKEEPTWAFFGGVLTVSNGNKYQVVNH